MGKRLITQRRGRGFGRYRSPSHLRFTDAKHPKLKETVNGTITELKHEAGRIAPLAKVEYGGAEHWMLAPDGILVGQEVTFGRRGAITAGNTMPVGDMPEGTLLHNIELQPGDGGKLARTAGNSATIVSHGAKTVVLLPSGKFKDIDNKCVATVGLVSGGGHTEKPFAKAGKKFHAYGAKSKAYFSVKGVAKNPVDHPHGGGSHPHVGTQSSVGRNTPPGRKVGRLAPQKKVRKV
ncbi:MAG: 50S ribosomal protein L2 [Thermoplasmata archaeon]|jgi:large subunit ribosomal protein L2|nr:50S ribosomal protein L2 [Thermoplasmata archaeon]TFG70681.1 MAG: 50S ribosomal protein L2 [Methanomassiliicoccus sp.]